MGNSMFIYTMSILEKIPKLECLKGN